MPGGGAKFREHFCVQRKGLGSTVFGLGSRPFVVRGSPPGLPADESDLMLQRR